MWSGKIAIVATVTDDKFELGKIRLRGRMDGKRTAYSKE